MRKQLLTPEPQSQRLPDSAWLDLDKVAHVAITSEDPAHPIEEALVGGGEGGWWAASAGEQTIRLTFPEPQTLRRVRIEFAETTAARTQEFLLRYSTDGGATYRDVVRQQFHFSPPGTARQIEDYGVELDGVTTLELIIVPDVQRGGARASLRRLQLSSAPRPRE
jgi:hypothetical protein